MTEVLGGIIESFRGNGNILHTFYSQTQTQYLIILFLDRSLWQKTGGSRVATVTSCMSDSYSCGCTGKFNQPLEEPLVDDLIFTGPWGQIMIQKTGYCSIDLEQSLNCKRLFGSPQLWRWSGQNPKTGTSVLYKIPGLQVLHSREKLHYHDTAYFPVVGKENTHIFVKITQH